MSVSQEIGPSGRVAIYRLPDSELATGSTLGGPKVALTLKGTGAIDHVFSIDQGEDLFGTVAVNYWDPASGARLAPSPARSRSILNTRSTSLCWTSAFGSGRTCSF